MKLQGSHLFQASQDDVWDALMDPTILAQALPGGEALQQVAENVYQAVINLRVGPVQGRFEGGIELTEIQPKNSYRMKVTGQGAPGFLSGEGNLNLTPAASGGVELAYTGDVQIGGKIAGLSQRLVESTARSVIKQGLAALDAQIQLRLAPAELVTPPPAPLTAPREARDMVSEGGPVLPAEVEALAPAIDAATLPLSGDAALPWQPLASPEPRTLESRANAARPTALPRVDGNESLKSRAPIFTATASATASANANATANFGDPALLRNVITDVISDFAADYIPRQHQEKALWAVIGAAGAFLFVALVRLVQRR